MPPNQQGSRVILSPFENCRLTCVLVLALWVATLTSDSTAVEPYRLQLEAPIETWDEAIPLGNGLTGGLLELEAIR